MKKLYVVTLALLASGCALSLDKPRTLGEDAANYGYVPVDPLPVRDEGQGRCSSPELLDRLPDLSVRFAVADAEQAAGLEFGPSQVTAKNQTYRAVLDYINADSIPAVMQIDKIVRGKGRVPFSVTEYDHDLVGFDANLIGFGRAGRSDFAASEEENVLVFPIYVGVGLRLTADIRALKGKINLSSLASIGANAEADNLTGTMTVQTLGVTGKPIATALPLPNKLDQTTIEQSILAIGTTRAILYNTGADDENVVKQPRVVGIYSPVDTDPRLINAVYSELSKQTIPWVPACFD